MFWRQVVDWASPGPVVLQRRVGAPANERAFENARIASEFGQLAKFLVLAKGNIAHAAILADEARATKVRDVLRSVQIARALCAIRLSDTECARQQCDCGVNSCNN
jgi:hypothetical protein